MMKQTIYADDCIEMLSTGLHSLAMMLQFSQNAVLLAALIMPSFVWKVTGLPLKALKTANEKQSFTGPTFNTFGGKLMVCMYPNGHNTASVGKIFPYILLQRSQEQKEQGIQLTYAVVASCVETDKSVGTSSAAGAWNYFGYQDIGSLSDITEYDSITIKLEVGLIQVRDKDGNDMTHLYAEQDEMKQSVNAQINVPRAIFIKVGVKNNKFKDG